MFGELLAVAMELGGAEGETGGGAGQNSPLTPVAFTAARINRSARFRSQAAQLAPQGSGFVPTTAPGLISVPHLTLRPAQYNGSTKMPLRWNSGWFADGGTTDIPRRWRWERGCRRRPSGPLLPQGPGLISFLHLRLAPPSKMVRPGCRSAGAPDGSRTEVLQIYRAAGAGDGVAADGPAVRYYLKAPAKGAKVRPPPLLRTKTRRPRSSQCNDPTQVRDG